MSKKMAEDLKSHKINVILTTNSKWKSEDVATQVVELLKMDNDVEEPEFTNIIASSDPSNPDTDLQDSIEGVIELIGLYTSLLKVNIGVHKGLKMLKGGVETLEHGVVDLRACLRCIEYMASEPPDIKVAKVNLDDLGDAPEEIIHATAHMLGLGRGECESMSKEEMIDWIKNSMRSEPRTIN